MTGETNESDLTGFQFTETPITFELRRKPLIEFETDNITFKFDDSCGKQPEEHLTNLQYVRDIIDRPRLILSGYRGRLAITYIAAYPPQSMSATGACLADEKSLDLSVDVRKWDGNLIIVNFAPLRVKRDGYGLPIDWDKTHGTVLWKEEQ